jgi:hypothetical protein
MLRKRKIGSQLATIVAALALAIGLLLLVYNHTILPREARFSLWVEWVEPQRRLVLPKSIEQLLYAVPILCCTGFGLIGIALATNPRWGDKSPWPPSVGAAWGGTVGLMFGTVSALTFVSFHGLPELIAMFYLRETFLTTAHVSFTDSLLTWAILSADWFVLLTTGVGLMAGLARIRCSLGMLASGLSLLALAAGGTLLTLGKEELGLTDLGTMLGMAAAVALALALFRPADWSRSSATARDSG